MRGESPGGGIARVLVHEYVTGGGLVGEDLPPTWAAEGAAIRRAIVEDFARVPGVAVVATVDARLDPGGDRPNVAYRIIADRDDRAFETIAAAADWVALIAPETGGVLADLTRVVEAVGGRSLGSSPGAIARVGDKLGLAGHFEALGIPTPPTRRFDPAAPRPAGWAGPILLKPADGAGSVETFVVEEGRPIPPGASRSRNLVVQPYLPGEPMSASFLVDRDGRSTLLAVGRQTVEVEPGGRVAYRGGTIPGSRGPCPAPVAAAVASVAGLRGFVGVDFLVGTGGSVHVLEINPRPTTSYVGLARLLPPGRLAGAWLAAVARGFDGTDWPDRLRPPRDASPVSFGADGSIRPGGPER